MARSKQAGGLDVGTVAAGLKVIPDGKVVDFVTGILMNDTPEEYVRQSGRKFGRLRPCNE